MTFLNVVVVLLACFAKLKFITCALPNFDGLVCPTAIRSPPKVHLAGFSSPAHRYASRFSDDEDESSYDETHSYSATSEDEEEEVFAIALANSMQKDSSNAYLPSQDFQFNEENLGQPISAYANILGNSYVVPQTDASPNQPHYDQPIFFMKPTINEIQIPKGTLFRSERELKRTSSGTATYLTLNPHARNFTK